MYSPRIVEAAREKLQRALGIELRESTFAEVREMELRLNPPGRAKENAFDALGQQLRALDAEEQEFITRNRLLAKIDFRYFLTRFCLILTDQKKLEPVIPWPSQEKVLRVLAEEEERQTPFGEVKVPMVLLKSRQVGGTVMGEALVAHLVFLNANTQGLIASDHPDTSLITLYHTLTRIYDNLPKWLRPVLDGRVKGEHLHFPALDSNVLVGAGNQRTTLGQGMTIDAAHLTELSTWEFPSYIDEDLMPAFNSSHKHHTFILMESTGAGAKGNWFYEHFMAAWQKKTSFRAIFAPWYLRPNNRLRSEGYEFLPHTQDMAKRVLQETGQELDKEQLAYYQFTRRDFENKGELDKFYQEHPSTIEEAFQTGVKSAFSIELRSRLRDKVKPPIFVGEVNLDTQKLVKQDLAEWKASEDPGKFSRKLLMYELPRPGKMYIVGVDASHGLEQDNAVVEVLRVGDRKEKDEQVAEWCGDIHPSDLGIVAGLVGRIYRDKSADLDALMAVETNPGSPGGITQLALQHMGYNNFYMYQKPHDATGKMVWDYGWQTTTGTRGYLTTTLIEFLQKGDLLINSPWFIEEMGAFVKTRSAAGRWRFEAFEGYHDDRLIALAIALFIAHEQDAMNVAEERRKEQERKEKEKSNIVKPRQIWQLLASAEHGQTVESIMNKALESVDWK